MKTATAKNLNRPQLPPMPRVTNKKQARGGKAGVGAQEQRGRGKMRQRLYTDLDALAGSWSKREAATFDQALAKQRGIDTNLWR